MAFSTRTTYTPKTVRLAIQSWGAADHCTMSQVPISTFINLFVCLCRRRRRLIYSWDGFTVYPKKYAHGFCFAVLCCGYTLTDFPISIRLTSLALWQSNDCPSASKATLMNMDKYFMWIHYEQLHNHNKAKHNKTVCIFLGIYSMATSQFVMYIMQIKLNKVITFRKMKYSCYNI